MDTVGKYKFHRLQNLIGGKVKDVPDKPSMFPHSFLPLIEC